MRCSTAPLPPRKSTLDKKTELDFRQSPGENRPVCQRASLSNTDFKGGRGAIDRRFQATPTDFPPWVRLKFSSNSCPFARNENTHPRLMKNIQNLHFFQNFWQNQIKRHEIRLEAWQAYKCDATPFSASRLAPVPTWDHTCRNFQDNISWTWFFENSGQTAWIAMRFSRFACPCKIRWLKSGFGKKRWKCASDAEKCNAEIRRLESGFGKKPLKMIAICRYIQWNNPMKQETILKKPPKMNVDLIAVFNETRDKSNETDKKIEKIQWNKRQIQWNKKKHI